MKPLITLSYISYYMWNVFLYVKCLTIYDVSYYMIHVLIFTTLVANSTHLPICYISIYILQSLLFTTDLICCITYYSLHILVFATFVTNCDRTHFSSWSCNFVNDVCEDDVLIVRLDANLFPLRVLPQPDVVAEKRMTNAAQVKFG